MVVFAHPDDAEWGCAGTVALWCAMGWDVVYVMCTDGSKGSDDPGMTSQRLVEIRAREQENAGKVFEQGAKNGLDVAMSGFGCVATFQNPKDENEYWILGFLDPASVEGLYDEMEKALDNLPKEKEEQLKKDWSSFRERNKIGD